VTKLPHFLLIILLTAPVTIGCSALMYPGSGLYRPAPIAPRSRVTPELPLGRWDNVMRLPSQTIIDVLTRNGRATVGGFVDADEQYVRLQLADAEIPISRLDVVRIDLVALPGSTTRAVARRAAGGALLGVGIAALIGGVIGGEAWPPPGVLLRTGAAIGGAGGVESALAERRGRMIYLSPSMVRP
jgi:hypothetical protein